MRNTLAIWQREMKSYFVSPIAYVVLTIFLFISGFFFYSILTAVIQSTMMQSQFGPGSQPVDVPGIVSRSYFGTTSVVLLFMIPMLTMGLFAEEKRRGTIELLLTNPVSIVQVMFGKYLASLTFLVLMFLGSGITLSALFIFGHPEWKTILGGYVGLFLYGGPGSFHLHPDREPDRLGRDHIRHDPGSVADRVVLERSDRSREECPGLHVGDRAPGRFHQGRHRHEPHHLLSDICTDGAVSDLSLA